MINLKPGLEARRLGLALAVLPCEGHQLTLPDAEYDRIDVSSLGWRYRF